MSLSQKSINFARKILKYNPEVQAQSKCSTKSEHECNKTHETTHSHQKQLKPFLHVHDHRKEREIFEKSTAEKLSCMKMFKDQGNERFKVKQFQQAAYFYRKAVVFGDYTFPETEKQQKQMDLLVQQSNCNLGTSLIKLNDWEGCLTNFQQAIKGPSEKTVKKGLYWLSKIYLRKGETEKVKTLIDKMATLEDSKQSVEIIELQGEVKALEEKFDKNSKSSFKKMFQNETTSQN